MTFILWILYQFQIQCRIAGSSRDLIGCVVFRLDHAYKMADHTTELVIFKIFSFLRNGDSKELLISISIFYIIV